MENNYFCFIDDTEDYNIFVYNINKNKLINYNDIASSLCYNDKYLIYANNNIIYILNIETLQVIKVIYINQKENEHSYVINITNLVIINNNIICRINYFDYHMDRQGLFYKKSIMNTYSITNLELLYINDSFNVYNMIASNNKIIGQHYKNIIVFNEKLEKLSELNSNIYYNIYNDNIMLINNINMISPDGKYIYLYKCDSIEIWDINMKKLYEIIKKNLINYKIKITNDYRILYYDNNNINIIKTSLYYKFMNYIKEYLLDQSLPLEIIYMIMDY